MSEYKAAASERHDWRFVHASVYVEPPGEWRVYNCARCGMCADVPLSPDIVDMDGAIAGIELWLKGDKVIQECDQYRALVKQLRRERE